MLQWGIRAIIGVPIVGRPRVVVQVAHTPVISRYPVGGRQWGLEDIIHILVNRDVGVEENASVVGGKLESAELRPCVFEAGCYKGDRAGG